MIFQVLLILIWFTLIVMVFQEIVPRWNTVMCHFLYKHSTATLKTAIKLLRIILVYLYLLWE
jgi:hypothetical protein